MYEEDEKYMMKLEAEDTAPTYNTYGYFNNKNNKYRVVIENYYEHYTNIKEFNTKEEADNYLQKENTKLKEHFYKLLCCNQ